MKWLVHRALSIYRDKFARRGSCARNTEHTQVLLSLFRRQTDRHRDPSVPFHAFPRRVPYSSCYYYSLLQLVQAKQAPQAKDACRRRNGTAASWHGTARRSRDAVGRTHWPIFRARGGRQLPTLLGPVETRACGTARICAGTHQHAWAGRPRFF